MSVANGLAGLANMFFPMVPGAVVPKGLIVKEQGVVDGLNKEADYGEDNGGAKRGRELRDFELFLQVSNGASSAAYANKGRVLIGSLKRAIRGRGEPHKRLGRPTSKRI